MESQTSPEVPKETAGGQWSTCKIPKSTLALIAMASNLVAMAHPNSDGLQPTYDFFHILPVFASCWQKSKEHHLRVKLWQASLIIGLPKKTTLSEGDTLG